MPIRTVWADGLQRGKEASCMVVCFCPHCKKPTTPDGDRIQKLLPRTMQRVLRVVSFDEHPTKHLGGRYYLLDGNAWLHLQSHREGNGKKDTDPSVVKYFFSPEQEPADALAKLLEQQNRPKRQARRPYRALPLAR